MIFISEVIKTYDLKNYQLCLFCVSLMLCGCDGLS